MKFSSKLYTIRKFVSDLETLASGNLSKIFKRFFIRKPLYKLFNKLIRNV